MSESAIPVTRYSLPTATAGETLGAVAGVVLPVLARGVIIRRPKIVALAERLDLDRRAVKRVQKLHERYGAGPLRLKIPIRPQILILHPDHVHQVLEGTPDPFATATLEKQSALAHFQPQGVLISHGGERADRRRYNEAVLDADSPIHRLADEFIRVVDEEAAPLLQESRARGQMTWDDFIPVWMRIVRRVTLGDRAADDHELTDLMASLRSNANWAFMHRKQDDLRDRLYQRLRPYLDRAEPGSLAAEMSRARTTPGTEPEQQVPQWLFAFDPAGMATFRALALLASHPEQADRARGEIKQAVGTGARDLPLLRAAVLEALRLWPTTPMVLRETTMPTLWTNGLMPERSHLLIFAPYFHRDDRRLPDAHRFNPDIWLRPRTGDDWPLIPFSGGPGICPGRYLVLLLSSYMLANVLRAGDVRLVSHRKIKPGVDLPGTLNNYGLRFAIT